MNNAEKKATHNTKALKMSINSGNPSKKAGSNNLSITVKSESWRIPSQRVSMTVRDAKTLQSFLNEHLR